MSDKLEAQLTRNTFLYSFDIRIREFDDAPRIDIEKMVVVAAHGRFVAAASETEIVSLKDAFRRKKLQRPVDRRKRDARIDGVRAPVHFLDIGMIGCSRKHLRNDAALTSHAQSVLGTPAFERSLVLCASLGHEHPA